MKEWCKRGAKVRFKNEGSSYQVYEIILIDEDRGCFLGRGVWACRTELEPVEDNFSPKESLFEVQIQRNESSQPLVYEALNAYTKGELYCVLFMKDGKRLTHKYPLCSIFRIEEEYLASNIKIAQ